MADNNVLIEITGQGGCIDTEGESIRKAFLANNYKSVTFDDDGYDTLSRMKSFGHPFGTIDEYLEFRKGIVLKTPEDYRYVANVHPDGTSYLVENTTSSLLGTKIKITGAQAVDIAVAVQGMKAVGYTFTWLNAQYVDDMTLPSFSGADTNVHIKMNHVPWGG